MVAIFFVPGTIAPARELPDVNGGGNDEDPMKIFMANLNLVVPVVAAIFVIIVAVIVICVLRGKGHGGDKGNIPFFYCFNEQVRSHPLYAIMVTTTRMSGVISPGYLAGST